jgi:hypothetical protein
LKERGITRASRGVGFGVGSWFDERLVKVVGNETNTLLSSYESLEGVCVSCKFRQLFDLS